MRTLGIWALGVLAGGVALGALLGAAAEPDMKDPPEPWWQLTGREDVAEVGYVPPQPAPQGFRTSGGYRPDLDYDAEVWALPIPDYDATAWVGDPLEPFEDDLPESHFGVESAADEAEDAVSEALAAREEEEAPPAPAVRKSPLAKSGLY